MSKTYLEMACSQRQESDGEQKTEPKLLHPHELARDLHTQESYFLLDCQPLLAYNSCHITGILQYICKASTSILIYCHF